MAVKYSTPKEDQTLVFKTGYRLVKVKSIGECSFLIKVFLLCIFEWPLKKGFSVLQVPLVAVVHSKVVILLLLVYCSCSHYVKGFVFGPGLLIYSKTCLKQPLKNIQHKGLNDKWLLMKVKSIAECSHP